jgi:predicted regulator of Ras-like GTPase activity (Roadblock/LC7/MglB family)
MPVPQPHDLPAFGPALRRLAESPDMVGALVAARDGLPVALQMPEETGEAWAAMAAVLGNLAGQLLTESGDEMTAAVFTAENYQFVAMPVTVGFLLGVATPGADSAALYERVRAVAEDVNAAATALATNL